MTGGSLDQMFFSSHFIDIILNSFDERFEQYRKFNQNFGFFCDIELLLKVQKNSRAVHRPCDHFYWKRHAQSKKELTTKLEQINLHQALF